MKKIYSFVLMAAMLLVGTSANAVEVADYDELKTAITNAEAGVLTTIELTANITNAGCINVQQEKKIAIDLKGFNISSTADYMIIVANASLELKNTGETGEGHGVISGSGWAAYMQGTNENVENYSVLKIGAGVTLTTTNTYGIVMYNASAAPLNGYGMVLDVYGNVIVSNGIAVWVMGNIQAKDGYIPQVNVYAGGKLQGSTEEVCLYGGGYAAYNIQGTVEGGTAIYAKAGEYEITGNAVVKSTADHHETIEGNGNGYTGGLGTAIVSDTKAGYAGGMEIHISGNATIESTVSDGYAIEEVVSDQEGQSRTESLVIESGTINGNLEATADLKEEVKLNGTITGGTYSGNISEFIDASGAELTPTQVIDPVTQEPKTVYVVTVAVEVTPNSFGYSTFSAKKNVVVPAGVVAYKATGLTSGETVTLVPAQVFVAGNVIPANTGVILVGTPEAKFVETDASATAADLDDNLVKPSSAFDAAREAEANIYILHGNELWLYTGDNFPGNKAFFLLPGGSSAPARIRLAFEEAQGVENVEAAFKAEKFVENGQVLIKRGETIYNVQGQIVK